MNEKRKRKTVKALAICIVIVLAEFLILWLIAVLAINYGPDAYYFVNYFITIHSTLIGLTVAADIPLFILVFYFMLRQQNQVSQSL